MNDALSNRMKRYENVNRNYLTPRTYSIIRVDGKAFHTFTKKFERPFDESLVNMMNMTALYLAKKVQGCKLAYVQSDEISLLLTDFDDLNTSAWFDGNIQKIVSVSASMATSEFNRRLIMQYGQAGKGQIEPHLISATEVCAMKLAEFDSRTYTIPTKTEVTNYLIWRQKDATRNSIAMVAQSLCSVSELKNKNGDQQQELIFQKGQNWNNYDDGLKRGRLIMRVAESIPFTPSPNQLTWTDGEPTIRMKWRVVNPPIFTQNRDFLSNLIIENQ